MYHRESGYNVVLINPTHSLTFRHGQANAMVNNALGDGTINALGVVVLDELHLIDDDHRGYLMELMATKLLSLDQGTQIIGMSATLSVSGIVSNTFSAVADTG